MFDTFKKTCRIYYPPIIITCTSCLTTAINNYQGNVSVAGGTLNSLGLCDYCGGTGKIEREVYDDVDLLCNWTPQKFKELFPNLNVPDNSLITKAKVADVLKIRRCTYMVIQTPIESIINSKYKLAGEGSDQYCIIQNEWFFQIWSSA
jgi:hypothetical protein